MSRLGKQPINIPEGTTVTYEGGVLTVKGSNGTLTRTFKNIVSIDVHDNQIVLTPKKDNERALVLWGTYAAHINNMIKGVTEGFQKQLEIEGVGYRAETQGNKLVLHVGFSHPTEKIAPEGVMVTVEKNLITVKGADKELVGQFAADVRAVKKPEPYKGKGIHYVGEYIIRKQGKKAVA